MLAADLKVDHVTLAGHDISAMQRALADAGLPTEYGGKHSNGQTEMALASFPDGSYFELIAPQKGVDASAHYWANFMSKDAGPCAWAVTTRDMPGDARRLEAAGIPVKETASGRKRPDGIELKWRTATVGPPPQGSFFPFLIFDETPRERRVYPQGKATMPSVAGVSWVVVAVRDLSKAVASYRTAFGLGEPRMQSDAKWGARLASFPDTPVVLAGPEGANSRLAERLKQFGEAPCAFVLESNGSKQFRTAGESRWFSRNVHWLALAGTHESVGITVGR